MSNEPDREKIIRALKAAGVVIPDDHNLKEKFSSELSKQGAKAKPDLTLLANGNYVLVVPD